MKSRRLIVIGSSPRIAAVVGSPSPVDSSWEAMSRASRIRNGSQEPMAQEIQRMAPGDGMDAR